MQMKHEHDQNVHVYSDQQVLDYMQSFSLLQASIPKNELFMNICPRPTQH